MKMGSFVNRPIFGIISSFPLVTNCNQNEIKVLDNQIRLYFLLVYFLLVYFLLVFQGTQWRDCQQITISSAFISRSGVYTADGKS